MPLKPQDLLVVLKLWIGRGQVCTYQSLAQSLFMSAAEVHAAVKRARAAGFLPGEALSSAPNASALKEFLIHGAKYAFPASLGSVTRGVPTASAATPMKEELAFSDEFPPVWPHPKGSARGLAVEPLYASVPEAALADPALYELLSLLDALRVGRARERQIAGRLLEERLK